MRRMLALGNGVRSCLLGADVSLGRAGAGRQSLSAMPRVDGMDGPKVGALWMGVSVICFQPLLFKFSYSTGLHTLLTSRSVLRG
jgi:hypothetical protein